jgi:hypothetical protein
MDKLGPNYHRDKISTENFESEPRTEKISGRVISKQKLAVYIVNVFLLPLLLYQVRSKLTLLTVMSNCGKTS